MSAQSIATGRRDNGAVIGFLRAGTLAAGMYTLIVIIGGMVTPGYDHVADPVSALYQTGAPYALPIAAAFATYNVAVILFGLAIVRLVDRDAGPREGMGRAGAWTIVLAGIAGAIDAVFPQDPVGMAITGPGVLHIVFAGLASLLTMVAIGALGAWLLARPGLRPLGWYSLITLAVIFVFGGLTAAATASASPLMGLLERVPIFGFVQWLLLMSLALQRLASRSAPRIEQGKGSTP